MRTALPIAIALAAAACPKPTAPEPAAQVDLEALCPSVPPTGYAVHRAETSGASAGEAIAAARAAAREGLLQTACAGVSPERCHAIARRIAPWKDGHFDPRTGYACATVAIERASLDSLRQDEEAFQRDLRGLGERIARAAQGSSVWIADPRWQSGCSAGALGARLGGLLTNEVARHAAAAGGGGVFQVQPELAPGGGRVVLTAWGWRAPSTDPQPLEGFDFPLDLFGLEADPDACRTDAQLGLTSGSRTGARGLTVHLEVETDHGAVCEGATVEPVLSVLRPAEVQVYSVDRDGRALLVWPPPGGSGRVQDRVSLGTLRAVASPRGGDERLVAVAVEAGGRFGRSQGWTGFCKVDGTFVADLYPEGSAVGTATFTVLPAGTGGCPEVPDLATLRSTLHEPAPCR